MNILHLKYAVEVERTRSITGAAANLFMSQPNLSRAIKELEESLGITIFKRTSKGIVTTTQGEEFLDRAKSILRQLDEMEEAYKRDVPEHQNFNISTPRACYITRAFTSLVNSLDPNLEMDINYKETNALRAITNILQSNYNMGIIRYQTAFESYFLKMMEDKDLKHRDIWEFEYVALMDRSHPLAAKEHLGKDDFKDCIEIVHGDPYVPSLQIAYVRKAEFSDLTDKKVYIYERGTQYDLLNDVPNTFMWVSPLPKEVLDRHNVVQKRCKGLSHKYKDVLIYRDGYRLTPIDLRFMDELEKAKNEASLSLEE
ncbi:MAG: LysR family transcriptional regulator [Clostridia bacterium]|nr:LysR family transcriptional regulator [Clostridia bacterium]